MLRRIAKVLFAVAALAAVLVALLFALLPTVARTESARRWVERTLSRLSGFEVAIGELGVGYDLSVRASGFQVRATPAAEPFLTAANARLTVRPRLGASALVIRAETEGPHLYLDRLPSEAAGESEPARDSGPRWVPAFQIDVRAGFLHQAEHTLGPIELTLDPQGLSGAPRLNGKASLGAPRNELTWTADPRAGVRRIAFEAKGRIEDLQGLLGAAGIAPEKALTGKADVQLDGDVGWDAAGVSRAKAEFSLSGVEAHDEELTRAAQGLKGSGAVDATFAPGKDVAVKVQAWVAAGELLWDEFYVDLAQHAIDLNMSGRRDGRGFRVDKATASVAGLGNATASGSYIPDGERALRAEIEVPDLAAPFRVGVQEPFGKIHPWLGQAVVEGALRAEVSYAEGDRRTLLGKLRVTDGRISGPSVDVRGLAVELPLQIRASGADARREEGSIRVAGLSLAEVRLDDVRLDLISEPDAVSLAHPVELPLLGGALGLSRLAAADLGSPGRHATLGVSLRGLDLDQLSRALGGPRFSGTISGEIPEIIAGDGSIRSAGEIEVKAFDGAIRVRDLRIDQIFSSIPELSLDADAEEISLGRLTQELEVGRVTGVARGEIRDLVIVNGQAVSFDAWMETVDRPGVKQKISVTALRQMSIVGGSESDPLSRGVLSFFDEYGYAKMGFKCQLRNDRFALRGVESEEGKEYLVVGSTLPPRVNVVTHSQVISFSEMTRRLGRAMQAKSAAPAPEEGTEGNPR